MHNDHYTDARLIIASAIAARNLKVLRGSTEIASPRLAQVGVSAAVLIEFRLIEAARQLS